MMLLRVRESEGPVFVAVHALRRLILSTDLKTGRCRVEVETVEGEVFFVEEVGAAAAGQTVKSLLEAAEKDRPVFVQLTETGALRPVEPTGSEARKEGGS